MDSNNEERIEAPQFGRVSDFGDCYYQNLKDEDVVDIVRPLLVNAGYRFRPLDGKLETSEVSISWATPWHHIHHDHFLDCGIWHQVMFNFLTKATGHNWVPTGCQQCWKVVFRPKTLKQLFAVMQVQKGMGRPSKCGMETRDSVHGLYGSYWYNHSLETGLECYSAVCEEIKGHPDLGPDVITETNPLLKRACTEYEHGVGPSDLWVVTKEQIRVENLVNKYFVRDNSMRVQPQHMIVNVHRRWIEWAYSNGDPTYAEYTNGRPLYHPYVTYHHLLDKSEKTRQRFLNKFRRIYYFDYDK